MLRATAPSCTRADSSMSVCRIRCPRRGDTFNSFRNGQGAFLIGDWLSSSAELQPDVTGFYDEATGSIQYIVADPLTRRCAIIDPVLDFDPRSGSTRTTSADR